jgi:DNA-binding CsgD family transcriptional regulator
MTQLAISVEEQSFTPMTRAAVNEFIDARDLTQEQIDAVFRLNNQLIKSATDNFFAWSEAFHDGGLPKNALKKFAQGWGIGVGVVNQAIKRTPAEWKAAGEVLAAQNDNHRRERNASIQQMRAEGATQAAIAEAHGVSEPTVRDVLATATAADANNDQRVKLSDSEIEIIKHRVANGDSQSSVADDFGISQSKVSQLINGKNGHESKSQPKPAPVVEAPPTDGKLHSPSLALMQEQGHELNAQMQLNRKRYYDTMRLLFEDISKATKRFKTLSKLLNDDYAKNHGGMLARWHAYESLWADDFDGLATGARSYTALAQHAKAQLDSLNTTITQSHEHLRRIKPEHIIIHD